MDYEQGQFADQVGRISKMIVSLRTIQEYFMSVVRYNQLEDDEIAMVNKELKAFYDAAGSMQMDVKRVTNCHRCGKPFVVSRKNTSYCGRVYEEGDDNYSECSEVGSQETFQKKLLSDDSLRAYNRAYKTHHARMMKGAMTREEFKRWKDQAKMSLEEVQEGRMPLSRYIDWLKN